MTPSVFPRGSVFQSDRKQGTPPSAIGPSPSRSRRHRLVGVLAIALILAGALLAFQRLFGAADVASRIVFEDNFEQSSLNAAAWNTCHWWDQAGCTIATNSELEWYLPSQVSTVDGVLRLTAERRVAYGPDGTAFAFRSGMVTTGPSSFEAEAPKFAFTYGTVEVRARTPQGRGLWPAVWLLPASREPRPEIDMLEMLGHEPDKLLLHVHPKDLSKASLSHTERLTGTSLSEEWHTIRMQWSPGDLRFSINDSEIWQVTGDIVPTEPMYLVKNLAVGGVYPGPPDSNTRFPATFEIDYVRVTQEAS